MKDELRILYIFTMFIAVWLAWTGIVLVHEGWNFTGIISMLLGMTVAGAVLDSIRKD